MNAVVCTSVGPRPHRLDPSCWCRPVWVTCDCPDCDPNDRFLHHKDPTGSLDNQPRLSVFGSSMNRTGPGGPP